MKLILEQTSSKLAKVSIPCCTFELWGPLTLKHKQIEQYKNVKRLLPVVSARCASAASLQLGLLHWFPPPSPSTPPPGSVHWANRKLCKRVMRPPVSAPPPFSNRSLPPARVSLHHLHTICKNTCVVSFCTSSPVVCAPVTSRLQRGTRRWNVGWL